VFASAAIVIPTAVEESLSAPSNHLQGPPPRRHPEARRVSRRFLRGPGNV